MAASTRRKAVPVEKAALRNDTSPNRPAGKTARGARKTGKNRPPAKPAQSAASASAQRKKPAGRRTVRQRRREMETSLAAELSGLREIIDELLEQCGLKIQARVVALESQAAGRSPSGDSVPAFTGSQLERALERLQDLKVKPAKGRLKDLIRVGELVVDLRKILHRRP